MSVSAWHIVQVGSGEILRPCCLVFPVRRRHSDQEGQQPTLSDICRGSTLLLPAPPARQRSLQRQEGLSVLEAAEDQGRYAGRGADVTQAAGPVNQPTLPENRKV